MNYLYNGVEFPKLPEYNDESSGAHDFKHAFIVLVSETEYWLIFSEEPLVWDGSAYVFEDGESHSNVWTYKPATDTAFNQLVETKLMDYSWTDEKMIWADHPIISTVDGSVRRPYVAPVPVSPVQINPALLVQSFFTGQSLRRSRK